MTIGGTIVEETNRFFLYYAVTSGGVNNRGTIIRVALPPPPIEAALALTETNTFNLTWTGGYPPFRVEGRGGLAPEGWTNVVSDLADRAVVVPVVGQTSFFRVVGSE